MYPVLWHIPLPAWALPLSPSLLLVALVGAALVVLGWRKKVTEWTVIGLIAALGGTLAAIWFKGQTTAIAGLPLSSYGALLCVGLIAGWFLTSALGKRDGLDASLLGNAFFVAAVGGLLGARALYVVTNWSEVTSAADAFNTRRGGLAGYGALIVGVCAVALYLRWRRANVLVWADAAAPSIALGIVMARIGSYLLGSDFGSPLGASAPKWLGPLGTFPHWPANVLEGFGAPAWVHHVNQGLIPLEQTTSLPVHPTQLYEALAGLGLLGATLLVRRARRVPGEAFCTLIFAYGVVRWLLDATRDDPERGIVGPYLLAHHYLPLGLAGLALAWVAGPARFIQRPGLRHGVQGLALVAPILLFWWLSPPPFAPASAVQATISQWLGWVTAMAAAVVHGLLLNKTAERSRVVPVGDGLALKSGRGFPGLAQETRANDPDGAARGGSSDAQPDAPQRRNKTRRPRHAPGERHKRG